MKINQRKDGYYYCSKMLNGKRYQITGKSKSEVKQKLVNLEFELQNKIVLQKEINVKDWAYEWLNTYKKTVQYSTYKMYENAIRLHIVPYIGIIPLKKLKESDVMNMLNELIEKGLTRKKDVAFLTIKQILDKAISNHLIYINVAKDIKIKKHTAPEKKPIPPEYIEIIKNNLDKKYCRLCYFLLYTGLRREELIPLTYNDIDFKKKTIKIDKAIVFIKNQPQLKKTKNEAIRYVPLLDSIQSILSDFNNGLVLFFID